MKPVLALGLLVTLTSPRAPVAAAPPGSLRWEHSLGAVIGTSPALSPTGTVLAGAMDGKVYAVKGTGRPLAEGQWPMFRRDAQHRASRALPPAAPTEVAVSQAEFTDKIVVSWLSVAGATSYEVWRNTTAEFSTATVVSPAVTGTARFEDRSALPGNTYHYWVRARNAVGSSDAGAVVAGTRRQAQVGEVVWRFTAQGAIGTPAVAPDGAVSVGSSDGNLYALDANGLLEWRFAYAGSSTGTPTIAPDGTVYFTAGTRANTLDASGEARSLFALTPQGTQRWQHDSAARVASDVALAADGTVYVSGNELFAVNPDGIMRWQFPGTDAGVSAACIGADGTIYTGTSDGKFHALRANRTQAWVFQAPTLPGASACGEDGTVYFSATSNIFGPQYTLYALGPGGQRRWEFTLGNGIGVPVLGAQALVYFAAGDGNLYAVRTGGPVAQAPWPTYQHDAQHLGRATIVPPRPTAPATVSASDRTYPAYVRVEWTSVTGATGYEVYRSTGADPAGAEPIAGEVTGQTFLHDRQAQPEVSYTYWVRTRNPGGTSDWGQPARGARRQPVPGDVLYEWTLDGIVHASPALDAEGIVYVGVQTGTQSLLASRLYALAPDGTTRWSYTANVWIYGAAAVGPEGTIYYGSYHRNFIALNPDGRRRWEYVPGAAVIASPAVGVDGAVYVGALDGKLYAFNTDGTVRWSYAAASGVQTAPAIGGDGAVYFVAGPSFYALNPDGSLRWQVALGGGAVGAPVYSSPAIGADGTVYVGSDASIVAFHMDGTRRWTYPAGTLASPVIDTLGRIVIGSDQVLVLAPDGTLSWSYPTGPVWATAAVAADGSIYVGTRAGVLLALGADGTKAWEVNVGAPITSSPAIAPDGTIYVGADDGKVRAIHGTAPLAATPWPMYHRDLAHTGRGGPAPARPNAPPTLAASVGEFNDRIRVSWPSVPGAFYYEVWRSAQADRATATALAAGLSGTTVFEDKGVNAGMGYFYWVRAGNTLGMGEFVGPAEGVRRVAVAGEKVGEVRAEFSAASSPALGPTGTIYLGGRDGRFRAFDAELTLAWVFPSTGAGLGTPFAAFSVPTVAPDGTVYFTAPDARAYALRPDGTKRWELRIPEGLDLGPALARDGTVYVASSSGRKLLAVDPADGSIRWEYRSAAGLVTGPVVDMGGTILLGGTDRMLHAVDAQGNLRWKYNAQATIVDTPAVGPDGAVYLPVQARRLWAVDPGGTSRWSYQAGGEIGGSPVIGPDGTVYFGALDRKLYALGPDGKKRWEYLTGGAVRGSAAVGTDGTVWIGSDDGHLHAVSSSGERLWSVPARTSPIRRLVGSPAITADGRVLFGAEDAYLYAVKAGSSLAVTHWPMLLGNAQHSGRAPAWLGLAGGGDRLRFGAGESVQLEAVLTVPGRALVRAGLYAGTNLIAAAGSAPFALIWVEAALGTHEFTLRGVDDLGVVYRSGPLTIEVTSDVRVAIRLEAGEWPLLEFNTAAGRRYAVEYSSDLREWRATAAVFEAGNLRSAWRDEGPPGTESVPESVRQRFYRVRLEVAP